MTRSDRPWWVDAAYRLGVPAVIAGVLVWFLMSTVSTALASISTQLREHVTSTNFYLHAVCIHTARTEIERDADCQPPEVH